MHRLTAAIRLVSPSLISVAGVRWVNLLMVPAICVRGGSAVVPSVVVVLSVIPSVVMVLSVVVVLSVVPSVVVVLSVIPSVVVVLSVVPSVVVVLSVIPSVVVVLPVVPPVVVVLSVVPSVVVVLSVVPSVVVVLPVVPSVVVILSVLALTRTPALVVLPPITVVRNGVRNGSLNSVTVSSTLALAGIDGGANDIEDAGCDFQSIGLLCICRGCHESTNQGAD